MFKELVYGKCIYKDYEINEQGDIRSKKTNKILKKTINKYGYYAVSLSMGKRGKVKTIKVHKAIAETFLPNPDNLPFVDHIDENKLHCEVSNLQWISAKDNIKKHWKMVLENNRYCNNRKLTEKEVLYIRNHKEISWSKLAKMFNVSKTTIRNIKKYIVYTDIE